MDTMGKLMKCASNDDSITLKSEDNGDLLGLIFESKVLKFWEKKIDQIISKIFVWCSIGLINSENLVIFKFRN